MQRSALITGITGQDGMYLAELLHDEGYDVFGLVAGQNNPRVEKLQVTHPYVELISGNLLDLVSLMRAVSKAQPDEVYNLGALSFVASSWQNARLTSDVTGGGVLNLLEAIHFYQDSSGKQVRFYQASSSEMFGKAQQVPQTEGTHFWPRSPYGVAKVYAHYMTINFRESYGMHARSGILFNHESPRRGTEFVTRKISQSVARIKLGLQPTVELGNLDARRDWGFAGDYVRAMWLMLQQDEADDYVISSGETHSIRDVLDVAFDEVGLTDWEQYVEINPAYVRPAEVMQLVGDSSKARRALGWEPQVGFDEMVRMMVRHDVDEQSKRAAGLAS
ncbi:GDP-mannose 4,6-dehydratase [Rhodococcus sp. NPDC003994]